MPACRSRHWRGRHPGCFELFAHEPIRTHQRFEGKKVGIDALGAGKHIYVAIMAARVGSTPNRTSNGSRSLPPYGAVRRRQSRCVPRYPPEPQELRARKLGRVILNTTTEKPWSQYLLHAGGKQGVRPQPPVATKRVVRAQSQRHLHRRAGHDSATSGRWWVHQALRLRAPDTHRAAVRQLARVRRGGLLRFFALRSTRWA